MNRSKFRVNALIVSALLTGAGWAPTVAAQAADMTFFLTSVNPGKGADFGGLDGADAHCATLSKASGSGKTPWRAYLSTTGVVGVPGIEARDRIGKGPWQNIKGVVIAKNVDDLHSANSNMGKDTALSEKAEIISGSGDTPNAHDILTGSDPTGRYSTAVGDTTCTNWTSSAAGSAIVGHHDRKGLQNNRHAVSWNSSHGTRGCGMDALKSTGGAGLIYCFLAN